MILAGIKEEDDLGIDNERQGIAIGSLEEHHPHHKTAFQNHKDYYESSNISALQSTQDKGKLSRRGDKTIDSQKALLNNVVFKFEFPNEPRKMNARLVTMTEEERRQQEIEKYNQLRVNKSGVPQTDGSVTFYVIDSQWINQWTAFLKGETGIPREIDNVNLRNYIVKWRNSQNVNTGDDTMMQIKKNQDYVEVSAVMWRFLYDNYGCKPVITVRYFIPQSEGILPSIYKDVAANLNKQNDLEIYQDSIISESTLKKMNGNGKSDSQRQLKVIEGRYYTSIHEYPKLNQDILKLNLRDRQSFEIETFNSIQNKNNQSKKQIYLVSGWINDWLKFVTKNEDLKMPPPGPIDNTELEQVLVISDRKDRLKKN